MSPTPAKAQAQSFAQLASRAVVITPNENILLKREHILGQQNPSGGLFSSIEAQGIHRSGMHKVGPLTLCWAAVLLVFLAAQSAKSQPVTWTWMNGTGSATPNPFFGPQGVYGRRNEPGARQYAASWIDEQNRELYLWGGQDRLSQCM